MSWYYERIYVRTRRPNEPLVIWEGRVFFKEAIPDIQLIETTSPSYDDLGCGVCGTKTWWKTDKSPDEIADALLKSGLVSERDYVRDQLKAMSFELPNN